MMAWARSRWSSPDGEMGLGGSVLAGSVMYPGVAWIAACALSCVPIGFACSMHIREERFRPEGWNSPLFSGGFGASVGVIS